MSVPARRIRGGEWATGLTVGALVFACTLRLGVPFERPLEVVVGSAEAGTLRVLPDVGRGFYPGDGQELRVVGASEPQTLRVDVAEVAVRVECSLDSPDPRASIDAIALSTPAGADPLPSRPDPTSSGPTHRIASLPGPAGVSWPARFGALTLGLGAAFIGGSGAFGRWGARLDAGLVRGSLTSLVVAWVTFGIAFLALATAVDTYALLVQPIYDPPYWPISVFDPAWPTPWSPTVAAAVLLATGITLRAAPEDDRRRTATFLLLALATAVTTNSFHGWGIGFVEPSAGAHLYLADARTIENPWSFLRQFPQQGLHPHSRVHPPGAVLVYYALGSIVDNPGLMSLLLGTVSLLATGLFLVGLVHEIAPGRSTAGPLLIFGFLPAVQIYFFSSIDALICACFTGTVYCLLHRRAAVREVGGTLLLVASMALTFASLFLWVLLPLHALRERRSIRSFVVVGGLAVLAYAALFLVTGFDWIDALLGASRAENPHGFRLLTDPGSYVFSRLEGVAEIALFAGPALLLGWRRRRGLASEAARLSRLAVAVLALMLASGAFKTGETARACLFLEPLLVLPLCLSVTTDPGDTRTELVGMTWSLLVQTLAMQLLGDYYW